MGTSMAGHAISDHRRFACVTCASRQGDPGRCKLTRHALSTKAFGAEDVGPSRFPKLGWALLDPPRLDDIFVDTNVWGIWI